METPETQGTDVLLGAEFRKNCMDMFIVPCKGTETDFRAFNLKNLNIIDPLKENNNLGRSVHKGIHFSCSTKSTNRVINRFFPQVCPLLYYFAT